jgi:hypothetical protein
MEEMLQSYYAYSQRENKRVGRRCSVLQIALAEMRL